MAHNDKDTQIIGYAESWIVCPGDSVDIKISSTEKEYSHRLVRLNLSYRSPRGPLAVEEEISEVPAGRRKDERYQPARLESYALIPFCFRETIVAQFYVQPYLPDVGQRPVLRMLKFGHCSGTN